MKRRKKGEGGSQPIRELGISENQQRTISNIWVAVTTQHDMVVYICRELGGCADTCVKESIYREYRANLLRVKAIQIGIRSVTRLLATRFIAGTD